MVSATAITDISSLEIIISIMVNIIMALGLIYGFSRKIKKQNDDSMNSKLNVSDFKEYKVDHEKDHEKEEIHNKETRDQIKEIYFHLLGKK